MVAPCETSLLMNTINNFSNRNNSYWCQIPRVSVQEKKYWFPLIFPSFPSFPFISLNFVDLCCYVLLGVVLYCSALLCVALCCSVLLCVALRFSACVALCCYTCCSVLLCVALCCSVLFCVSLCCSVLLCVALCCSVLHRFQRLRQFRMNQLPGRLATNEDFA